MSSKSLADGVRGFARARGRDYGLTVIPAQSREGVPVQGSAPRSTASFLHPPEPSYTDYSQTGSLTNNDGRNEDQALTFPTPDTIPTFTAVDWMEPTNKRTFSLRSTISHGSWKSWNDRRIDSAIPYGTPTRRAPSIRSLSRRLSGWHDGSSSARFSFLGYDERHRDHFYQNTVASMNSDAGGNQETKENYEALDVLEFLEESRIAPKRNTLAAPQVTVSRPDENTARETTATLFAASDTSKPGHAWTGTEAEHKEERDIITGTGVDEKCLVSELEDEKCLVAELDPPEARDPAVVLTEKNLRTLGHIAEAIVTATRGVNEKDLPQLPLPAYPPTSAGGSETSSPPPKKPPTRRASVHQHLRRRSSTLFNFVCKGSTAGDPAATTAAKGIFQRVDALLAKRNPVRRQTAPPSTGPSNLATIRQMFASQHPSPHQPEGGALSHPQTYSLLQSFVAQWVRSQQSLLEYYREQGMYEEYRRQRREERQRRELEMIAEDAERQVYTKVKLEGWLANTVVASLAQAPPEAPAALPPGERVWDGGGGRIGDDVDEFDGLRPSSGGVIALEK